MSYLIRIRLRKNPSAYRSATGAEALTQALRRAINHDPSGVDWLHENASSIVDVMEEPNGPTSNLL
jgi:hypothetical protein